MAKMSQSEDTAERFRAYGYDVHTVDGNDMEAFLDNVRSRRSMRQPESRSLLFQEP